MSPLQGEKKYAFYLSTWYVLSTQKHGHIRPQGRPHEKEFKLFLNTKINATKVGTEKEDENMESVSILL